MSAKEKANARNYLSLCPRPSSPALIVRYKTIVQISRQAHRVQYLFARCISKRSIRLKCGTASPPGKHIDTTQRADKDQQLSRHTNNVWLKNPRWREQFVVHADLNDPVPQKRRRQNTKQAMGWRDMVQRTAASRDTRKQKMRNYELNGGTKKSEIREGEMTTKTHLNCHNALRPNLHVHSQDTAFVLLSPMMPWMLHGTSTDVQNHDGISLVIVALPKNWWSTILARNLHFAPLMQEMVQQPSSRDPPSSQRFMSSPVPTKKLWKAQHNGLINSYRFIHCT